MRDDYVEIALDGESLFPSPTTRYSANSPDVEELRTMLPQISVEQQVLEEVLLQEYGLSQIPKAGSTPTGKWNVQIQISLGQGRDEYRIFCRVTYTKPLSQLPSQQAESDISTEMGSSEKLRKTQFLNAVQRVLARSFQQMDLGGSDDYSAP